MSKYSKDPRSYYTYRVNARWRHSYYVFDLTTIGGYRHVSAKTSADVDASNVDFLFFRTPTEIDQDYSLAIDLTSTAMGPLSWLACINCFETDAKDDVVFNGNLPPLVIMENISALLTTKAYAACGQADYVFGNDNKWGAEVLHHREFEHYLPRAERCLLRKTTD